MQFWKSLARIVSISILVLVSKPDIEKKKFSFLSRSRRLIERNSRSRLEHEIGRKKSCLENWNRLLVTHWNTWLLVFLSKDLTTTVSPLFHCSQVPTLRVPAQDVFMFQFYINFKSHFNLSTWSYINHFLVIQ